MRQANYDPKLIQPMLRTEMASTLVMTIADNWITNVSVVIWIFPILFESCGRLIGVEA
jgi:hypothetical protein